jgi:hypothetical protein
MRLDLQAPFMALEDSHGRQHVVDRTSATAPPWSTLCAKSIPKPAAHMTTKLEGDDATVCSKCRAHYAIKIAWPAAQRTG